MTIDPKRAVEVIRGAARFVWSETHGSKSPDADTVGGHEAAKCLELGALAVEAGEELLFTRTHAQVKVSAAELIANIRGNAVSAYLAARGETSA